MTLVPQVVTAALTYTGTWTGFVAEVVLVYVLLE